MRTKKLLSVLLAALLAVGVLSISASAISADDLLGQPAPRATVALVGWPGDVQCDVSFSNWETGLVSWKWFLDTQTSPSSNGTGFNAQKTKGWTAVGWKAWMGEEATVADAGAILIGGKYYVIKGGEMNIATDGGTATKPGGSGIYSSSSAADSQEKLIVSVNPNAKVYGVRIVQLTIKARDTTDTAGKNAAEAAEILAGRTTPVEKSVYIAVELKSDSDLRDEIDKANKEYNKTDRYTDKYRTNLKNQINQANALLGTQPTEADVAIAIANLKAAVAGEGIAKIYKLVGWDAIDNALPDSFLGGLWNFIDIVNKIVEFVKAASVIVDPIFSFLGAVGKIFGFILPLFSGLGALL